VLGADGASMLSREVVLLLDALIQNQVADLKSAQQAAAEGLLQLSEYLKHLHDGYVDLPVVVLPTLNNLRAAREAELLSEHLVFLPEEGHVGDEQIGTQEYVALSPERLQQVCAKLRFYFQKALLGWFRAEQPDKMLQAVGKVSTNMVSLNRSRRLRALWWINTGLAEALESHRLEHNSAVKMLIGRMEREIRRFAELGEAAYDHTVPDELLKNLLYYIGLAESGATVTDKVKAAYHLDLYLPQGETLQELRQHYTTPGRDLWHSVANSVVDELQSLQGLLEKMQDGTPQLEHLAKLADKTAGLEKTLAMIGLGQAASLTQTLAEHLREKVERKEPQTREELLRISTHYAKLEKVLKEYAETGYDTTEAVFSADGELYDPSTTRSLMRTVLTELNKTQTKVVAFYKEGWAFLHLEEAVASLESVSGALGMAEAHELLPLVDTAARYLRDDLLATHREPSHDELSTFADVLTLLEASVSAKLQNEDYLSLLPIGFEKLRELDGFSPLNLLGTIDLAAVETDVEAKKKARLENPATLYQRLRNQNLQPAAMA